MPRRVPLLAAPLLAGAALLLPTPAALAARSTDVTVMTRNLFLGADLIPLALARQGSDFEQKASATLAQVRASDPKGRMKAIADEIVRARPDLVGLQEVSLWRTGPKGGGRAKRVLFDFMA